MKYSAEVKLKMTFEFECDEDGYKEAIDQLVKKSLCESYDIVDIDLMPLEDAEDE